MAQDTPKRKIKDSVFINSFQDKNICFDCISRSSRGSDVTKDAKELEAEVIQLA